MTALLISRVLQSRGHVRFSSLCFHDDACSLPSSQNIFPDYMCLIPCSLFQHTPADQSDCDNKSVWPARVDQESSLILRVQVK